MNEEYKPEPLTNDQCNRRDLADAIGLAHKRVRDVARALRHAYGDTGLIGEVDELQFSVQLIETTLSRAFPGWRP